MWAIGRYDLGLSEEEFWSITLRQYQLLNDRFAAAARWQEALNAVTPWLTAEMNRDRKRQRTPFTLRDFMLSEQAARPQRKSPDQGQLRAKLDRVFGGLGGKRGTNNR